MPKSQHRTAIDLATAALRDDKRALAALAALVHEEAARQDARTAACDVCAALPDVVDGARPDAPRTSSGMPVVLRFIARGPKRARCPGCGAPWVVDGEGRFEERRFRRATLSAALRAPDEKLLYPALFAADLGDPPEQQLGTVRSVLLRTIERAAFVPPDELTAERRAALHALVARLGGALAGVEAHRRAALAACPVCASLKDVEHSVQKGGEGAPLPAAAAAVIGDVELGSRGEAVVRCPGCDTPSLYREDYEFLAGGSEDEETLERLLVGPALTRLARAVDARDLAVLGAALAHVERVIAADWHDGQCPGCASPRVEAIDAMIDDTRMRCDACGREEWVGFYDMTDWYPSRP